MLGRATRRVITRSGSRKQTQHLYLKSCAIQGYQCTRSYWWQRKSPPPTSDTPPAPTQAIDPAKALEPESGLNVGIHDSITSAPDVATVVSDQSYGYLPTDFLRQGIELLHDSTGTPYWTVIIGGTLALRLILSPTLISPMRVQGKLDAVIQELNVIMDEAEALLAQIKTEEDPDGTKRARLKELEEQAQEVHAKSKLSADIFKPSKVPRALHALTFGTCIMTLKDMDRYIPAWKEGGPAWFTDLSLPDTTYILPAVVGASLFVWAQTWPIPWENAGEEEDFVKATAVFSALSIPMLGSLPSGVLLYMATNSSITAVGSVLRSLPSVQKLLSIPPRYIPKPRPSRYATERKGFYVKLKKDQPPAAGGSEAKGDITSKET